jgi:carbamoyl-phosphate synthase large subunit
MKSTGEVIGLDTDYAIAFAKSQIGAGSKVPREGTAFISVRDDDKAFILDFTRDLVGAGFQIVATAGTQKYLSENGVPATRVNKVLEGRPHIVDLLKNGGVQLVINTTEGQKAISDSRDIRRAALLGKVPYYTTIPGAQAAVEGILAYRSGNLTVRPVQEYFAA